MLILSSRVEGAKKLQPAKSSVAPVPQKPKSVADKAVETVGGISDRVDRSPVVSHALTIGASVARSFKAFPNFVYPSIYDATAAERTAILNTLDNLPLHHVNDVKSIRFVPDIPNPEPGWVTNGQAWGFGPSNEISLSRTQLTNADKIGATLTHEIGHTTDYESRWFKLFGERSSRAPFGQGNHVSEYAKTNHFEDFAESYKNYHRNPEALKKASPEKFEAIERMSKPSALQSLIDRPEFRETGKFIAETIGPNRGVRHGVQTAYYASSILQLTHGISQWHRSRETGDAMGHASGILNTASGLAFFSGMSPLVGMAFQGANHALNRSVGRGQLTPDEVESTVALPARPIEALFGRKATEIKDQHRPGKVAAVALGGAVGGTAGSLIGPYLGVMAGYHIAGGLGGALGMIAGGLGGFIVGAELGGRAGGALAGL